MRLNFKQLIPSLLFTILFLIILEIISTALLPAIGFQEYKIPFNVMVVLYLGFKLDLPILPLLILLVQYVHSFFSIEGWAIGTCTGIVVCIIIGYLRDIIHFSSVILAMIITQIFLMVWFVISSSLIYLKLGRMDYLIEKFWHFIPESLLVSLIAPLFYSFLDKIWKRKNRDAIGAE